MYRKKSNTNTKNFNSNCLLELTFLLFHCKYLYSNLLQVSPYQVGVPRQAYLNYSQSQCF